MGRLKSLATFAVVVGMIFISAATAGWIPAGFPFPVQAAAAASVLVVVGGALLLFADAWSGFRKKFPSGAQRKEVVAQATQLGLRSLWRDRTSLDLSFPFLQPPPVISTWLALRRTLAALSVTLWALYAIVVIVALLISGADNTTRAAQVGGAAIPLALVVFVLADIPGWLRERSRRRDTATGFAAKFIRPRAAGFDRVFAGTWNDMDVRVFDYWSLFGSLEQKWTCAQLPLLAESPEIQLTRGPVGRVTLLGILGGVESDEESLRILSEREGVAQRFIDGRVRSQLEADDVVWDLIHLRKQRMLYCGPRQPLESRGAVLEAAKKVRDSFPAS